MAQCDMGFSGYVCNKNRRTFIPTRATDRTKIDRVLGHDYCNCNRYIVLLSAAIHPLQQNFTSQKTVLHHSLNRTEQIPQKEIVYPLMKTLLYYQNKLIFRYSIANAILSLLMPIVAIIFIIFTKLHIIGFFMIMPSLIYLIKSHSITYFSVDTQNIIPICGVKMSIYRYLATLFFDMSSVSILICTTVFALYEPKCIPILIGYLIAVLSVISVVFAILKRLPIGIYIYMLFLFPLTCFASFYAGSGRGMLIQANDFLLNSHSLGIVIACTAVISLPLSAMLIKHIIIRRPFCSPEVVAKNTNRK